MKRGTKSSSPSVYYEQFLVYTGTIAQGKHLYKSYKFQPRLVPSFPQNAVFCFRALCFLGGASILRA
eukprot:1894273-Rhodomonas_salina.1